MEKNKKKQEFALDEKKTAQQQARKELEQLKSKFVNLLMRNGEKSKAIRLFENSLNGLQSKERALKDEKSAQPNHSEQQRKNQKKTLKREERESPSTLNHTIEPLKEKILFLKKKILWEAVENVRPTLELRRVKRGGATYQVPAIVNQKRQSILAIKWIIESAEKRKRKSKSTFSDCLVREIVEAFNKTGQPRQKRDEQLKIAEYNRAYTRYRWW